VSQSASGLLIAGHRALAGVVLRHGWDADELMRSAGISPRTLSAIAKAAKCGETGHPAARGLNPAYDAIIPIRPDIIRYYR
jgi:hypothetical protein